MKQNTQQMNKKKIKYNWKKDKDFWEILNNEQWICKIPKLGWTFSIYTDKEENYSECSIFFADDMSYDHSIKTGRFNLEKAKKYCEKYFESFLNKIIKNYV